jgi:soluble lytic murein transglycosylase
MSTQIPRARFQPVLLTLVLLILLQPFATRAQDTALASADNALYVGDYTRAIAEYTALTSGEQRCPALTGLGTAYFRNAQYSEADAALTQLLNACGAAFEPLVLRAQARETLGPQGIPGALEDYQAAITLTPGVIDSYLYERMAALSPDDSIRYLRLATEADRQPQSKFALRERLAQIYAYVGAAPEALNEYQGLLDDINRYIAELAPIEDSEFDTSGERRARIEALAAELELQLGNPNAAYARWQRIITDYWETSAALPALIDLVTANQPVDLLQRQRINVRNENYAPAIDVLTSYLNDPANASPAPELYLLLGRAQRGAGDPQSALTSFNRVRQLYPNDPAVATAITEIAQTYRDAGAYADAVAAYTAVVTTMPQSPEAPQALLRAAEVERTNGSVANAVALYNQLADQYPDSEAAQEGLVEAGFTLMSSDPAQAAVVLGRASHSAEALLWRGKLLQQQGDSAGATQSWQAAAQAEPGDYFAMRACELLTGFDPFAAPAVAPTLPTGPEDRAAAEAWATQAFGQPASAALSPELAANPMLQRGIALWRVGLYEEARGEFDVLHALKRSSPLDLFQLTFHYHDVGVYRSSVYAAIRLIYLSGQTLDQIPTAVMHLSYPFEYRDLFIQAALADGLDPLLVVALVRQETSFDATAVSPVGARGLLQFMPATAQDVASQLGMTNFALSDLNRPIVAIPFGTHYLSSMQAFQGGSAAGALLSYNAGPGAAQGWLAQAGNDLDQLYRVISYDESRAYLELIHGNYIVYQYLYGREVPACMFGGSV